MYVCVRVLLGAAAGAVGNCVWCHWGRGVGPVLFGQVGGVSQGRRVSQEWRCGQLMTRILFFGGFT